jgi:hypothetical protein
MANHTQAQTVQGVTRGVVYAYLSHEDLSAAATTEAVLWSALVTAHPDGAAMPPANSRITYVHANLIEVFAGGSVSACTIALGKSGATTEQMTALNVFTGAALGLKPKTGAYTGLVIEAAYAPLLTVATTNGNVEALTSGLIEYAIHYETITATRQVRVAG